MSLSVNFIERRDPETGSIETVFREVGGALTKLGVEVRYEKLPFGNDAAGMIKNLVAFRPKPADIYHITGHAHYIAMRLPARNTVLTIHDLAILRQRAGARRFILKQLLFDLPVRRLRYVTAISENTKRELVAETRCPPDKIRVIHDPLRSSFRQIEKEFNVAEPLILQIGTAPHKNLETLTVALKGVTCRLRIVGTLSAKQINFLTEQGINFENVDQLSEEQMYSEYANADIVAFCSTSEGFGLPIIEAQAVGRSLVTSKIPPMSEVAGPNAVLVDPYNSTEIRTAINNFIKNSSLRTKVIESGLKNVGRFRSDHIAKEYLSLYEEIIKQGELSIQK